MKDYLVIDSGYKHGKDKNVLFATNDRKEAITVTEECGSGVLVVRQCEELANEKIIFISPYKTEISLKSKSKESRTNNSAAFLLFY